MSEKEKKLIEKLRKVLTKANDNYYKKGTSEITDLEYDDLMKELEVLEKKYPQYNDPNSLALVIWVLDKLISTSLMAKKNTSPVKYLESLRMWQSKVNLYSSFIRKKGSNLFSLSKDIFEIEKAFKGIKKLDAWKEIERLIIKICSN